MRVLLSLLCVLAAQAPRKASANPLDFFGDGARAAAMGGANTAGAMDASANYYNPALLSRLQNMVFEVGYQWAKPVTKIDGRSLNVDTIRGTRFAAGIPGEIGGARFGFGIGARIPDQHIMRMRSLDQNQPRYVLYDNLAQRLYMSANFAAAVGDRLSLGVGAGFFAQTAGSVDLVGRLGLMPVDSELAIAMDMKVKRMVYPQGGIAFQATPWLRLAGSYRGGLKPKLEQTVRIAGDVGAAGKEPVVTNASVALASATLMHFQPEQFSLGFFAQLTPRLGTSFDAALHRWSKFGSPAAEIHSELDLNEFNDLFDPPEDEVLAEPNFHDVILVHAGGEYLLNPGADSEYTLRGGYRFEPSPAPEQVGITNFVDNDKHTLSVGVGAAYSRLTSVFLKPLLVDLMVASTFLPERSHHKVSPVDQVGDYRSSGWVWQFALTTRMPL
jgi:long-chain fatty acid transport protein